MAGFVERKLMKQISCETCLHLIHECAIVNSTFINKKSYGYLHYPRVDSYKMILAADKIFNIFKIQNNLSKKCISCNNYKHNTSYFDIYNLINNFNNHVKEC